MTKVISTFMVEGNPVDKVYVSDGLEVYRYLSEDQAEGIFYVCREETGEVLFKIEADTDMGQGQGYLSDFCIKSI